MRVERLISILQTMPPDAEVGLQVGGSEDGAKAISFVREIPFEGGFDHESLSHDVRNTFVTIAGMGEEELEAEDREWQLAELDEDIWGMSDMPGGIMGQHEPPM